MDLDTIFERTRESQSRAAAPQNSSWVSANAGTGKTYVLVRRVLRLLLQGTPAEKILCLTFTKAAASEMANRLFGELSTWSTMEEAELETQLREVLGKAPTTREKNVARRLFARALETPGGLKVQTIHAFCERLLQRFPLEAGIAPHFRVMDDELQREIMQASIDSVLSGAVRNAQLNQLGEAANTNQPADLGSALLTVAAYAGEDRFEEILRDVLGDRDRLRAALRFGELDSASETPLLRRLAVRLGLDPNLTDDTIAQGQAALLGDDELAQFIPALMAGKATDQKLAQHLAAAKAARGEYARIEAFAEAFLTKEGLARSDRFITKSVREDNPAIAERLSRARDEFAALSAKKTALRMAKASAALITLGDAVQQNYEEQKAARSSLDFDDLILKSADLLRLRPQAAWVLYKLDGGIDHILVDEAQDTSPAAWTVIDFLAEEFFSGHGARNVIRTIFAVGDEKQSIYGFQGARPEKFVEMGELFRRKAEIGGFGWHRIPLQLSFRSTSPVLQAVDEVFGAGGKIPGFLGKQRDGGDLEGGASLNTDPSALVRHFAHRITDPGLVEMWESEAYDKTDPADPWQPLADKPEDDPINRVAERIATKIRFWLDDKTQLSSKGKPIRPGDILILVRKRAPFAAPMIRALKARNIPVAGADRIRLSEQLAVKDLMSLGQFLLLPQDDLSLAEVLKSPLFDLDDDDLFAIGYKRRSLLWEGLRDKARENNPRFMAPYETLRRLLALADLAPPYEFFASLLDRLDARKKFIARLGPEAGDAIDEFLNMALRYDEANPPSLQGFVEWMRLNVSEIKRDMEQGRDEVRVMTVHGAKGLEADIVFMPDTCSSQGAERGKSVVALKASAKQSDRAEALLWAIPDAKKHEDVEAARRAHSESEREEYYRLLYVAMTRARDRLYICGFERKNGRQAGCWYDILEQALQPHMAIAKDETDRFVWRMENAAAEMPRASETQEAAPSPAEPLPEWTNARAPAVQQRVIPVSPSRYYPLTPSGELEDDLEPSEGAPLARSELPSSLADNKSDVLQDLDLDIPADDLISQQPSMPPRQMAHETRFLRGQLTHSLLQYLPELPQDGWAQAARELVELRGQALSAAARKSIVAETLTVLTHPEFAALFGPDSAAEVPLTARIEPADLAELTAEHSAGQAEEQRGEKPHGNALPIVISGQIDRMAILPDEILIVDYKTNRPPPQREDAVAEAYLMQLAAYRLALRQIFPGRALRLALLWTDGPHLMPISDNLLKKHEKTLVAGPGKRG